MKWYFYIFLWCCHLHADGQFRKIKVCFTSDYDTTKPITVDQVFLNKYPLRNGEKIRIGKHRIDAKKPGYKSISENIVVRFSDKPFIYKRKLRSSPRQVIANIHASFPQMRIRPEKLTLNGKPVLGQCFKPGKYRLQIQRRGYIPVDKIIEIPPAEQPYTISYMLDPKDVILVWNITYDVPPESNSKYVLRLQRDVCSTYTNNTQKVSPENYTYTITQPGYQTVKKNLLVMPRETPYVIHQRLIAQKRNVVVNVVDENGRFVVIDMIKFDGFMLDKTTLIKPGVYEMAIEKVGYAPIDKKVKVLASDKDFVIYEELQLCSQ
ncbi:hypothetical protein [Candidatus Uabimicrobium amorphum]|uniref:PEGA domain-containing protein n=1 Tax=Uabimicrobium amorphum TaxID=2596890 RepID=A0A5S9ITB0_UABAM|nr:hypothetical protein [Candidatus Uabimicrobium amorphum]BBM87236.1 hypothetical protein UABAM_05639 [Candidatus Uabimicrobium amorphum]